MLLLLPQSKHVMEVWQGVVGFEGFYEVSDQGRVRSVERTYTDKKGVSRRVRAKIIKPVAADGYLRVVLIVNRKRSYKSLHGLVAESHIGPRPEGLVVRHLNGERTDNRKVNLAYGTHKQNIQERAPFSQSVSHLTEEQVLEIVERRNEGQSVIDIASTFDVSPTTVSNIYSGKTWGHLASKRAMPKNAKKLSVEQVVQIRILRSQGKKVTEIAKVFDIQHKTVGLVAAHKIYTSVKEGPLTELGTMRVLK